MTVTPRWTLDELRDLHDRLEAKGVKIVELDHDETRSQRFADVATESERAAARYAVCSLSPGRRGNGAHVTDVNTVGLKGRRGHKERAYKWHRASSVAPTLPTALYFALAGTPSSYYGDYIGWVPDCVMRELHADALAENAARDAGQAVPDPVRLVVGRAFDIPQGQLAKPKHRTARPTKRQETTMPDETTPARDLERELRRAIVTAEEQRDQAVRQFAATADELTKLRREMHDLAERVTHAEGERDRAIERLREVEAQRDQLADERARTTDPDDTQTATLRAELDVMTRERDAAIERHDATRAELDRVKALAQKYRNRLTGTPDDPPTDEREDATVTSITPAPDPTPTKAERRERNRRLAAALRARGIEPRGEAWRVARARLDDDGMSVDGAANISPAVYGIADVG